MLTTEEEKYLAYKSMW